MFYGKDGLPPALLLCMLPFHTNGIVLPCIHPKYFGKQPLSKNKIAQGDVTIFSHLTFLKFFYVFFIDLTQNFSCNRLNIIKFVIYGSELIEIDTLLARFQKF